MTKMETQWINKAGEKLYHVKRDDIIGKNIDYLEKAGIFSPSVAKLAIGKKKISAYCIAIKREKGFSQPEALSSTNGELQNHYNFPRHHRIDSSKESIGRYAKQTR